VRNPGAGPSIFIRLRGIRYLRSTANARRAEGRESGPSLGNPKRVVHDPIQKVAHGVVLSCIHRMAFAGRRFRSMACRSRAAGLAAGCSALRNAGATHGDSCGCRLAFHARLLHLARQSENAAWLQVHENRCISAERVDSGVFVCGSSTHFCSHAFGGCL
jgi:hypothetical protein